MNVLFIVWDACRLDYAEEHAKCLYDIGQSGVIFENAVAPSNWTRPSHTSMFNGSSPSEHGVTQAGYSHMPTELVSHLNQRDYATYSVTGNDHLSYKTAFTEQFEHSFYTRYPQSQSGIDFFRRSRAIDASSKPELVSKLVYESMTNKNRIDNMQNLLRFVFHQGINTKSINYIHKYQYYYNMCRSGRDERVLRQMIQKGSNIDDPFFIFTNNKSTHAPLVPTQALQEEQLGEVLSVSELKRLNNGLANSWPFERLVSNNKVDETDLETVRKLYAASVRESDQSLKTLVKELKYQGVYDDTVVIITADHGESLGEKGIDGRRRYGHGNSISSQVFRVPLIVLHPYLESDTISKPFELKNIYNMIRLFTDRNRDVDIEDITELLSDHAICEFPATGGMQAAQRRHPQISSKYLRRKCLHDLAVAYDGNSYIVAERSADDEVSCTEFIQNDSNEKKLREAAIKSVDMLSEYSPQEYSEETISLMEDMGYI